MSILIYFSQLYYVSVILAILLKLTLLFVHSEPLVEALSTVPALVDLILANVSRVDTSIQDEMLLAYFSYLIPRFFRVFDVLIYSWPPYLLDRHRLALVALQFGFSPSNASCFAILDASVSVFGPEGAHGLERLDSDYPQVD